MEEGSDVGNETEEKKQQRTKDWSSYRRETEWSESDERNVYRNDTRNETERLRERSRDREREGNERERERKGEGDRARGSKRERGHERRWCLRC